MMLTSLFNLFNGKKQLLMKKTAVSVQVSALLLLALAFLSTNRNQKFNYNANFNDSEARWVDSVYNSFSETERLGQLLMLRAHSDKDAVYEQAVEDQIRQIKPGGLCFFQGTIERQGALTNRYQAASKLPLLISMDAETGLGMRLRESGITYPRQLMLGALQDNRQIYLMGKEMARQCRRLGVHISFSPVADVNNNAANPVINERSFGEDRYNVAAKCYQYMMGLQDGGVLASAKHFPGHGDTQTDSHHELPQIPHSRARLDSLELFPFRLLVEHGVASFMVAHLNVPALDPREKRPTTLSEPVITDLLRNKMGFEGIIFTDAMEMQGVAKYFAPGYADVEALRAGVDIVLLPANPAASIEAIQKALADGTLDKNKIEASVRRVLRAKYRLGLSKPQQVSLDNLKAEINTPEALLLKQNLMQQAQTLVRDKQNLIGFNDQERYRFATLALGDTNRTVFQTYCGYYAPMTHFNADKVLDSLKIRQLFDSLYQYDVVLLSIHGTRTKASDNFGLNDMQVAFVNQLAKYKQVVLVHFGNPYALKYFEEIPTLLQSYTEDPYSQQAAAQAIFGAADISGKLPVTASANARYGQGLERNFGHKRIAYTFPEAVGMKTDTLLQIDALMAEAIRNGATPGGQVLILKNNKVVWNKAYGNYDYTPSTPVTPETLYDLASITKVAASTLSVMQLFDAGKLQLDTSIGTYLPDMNKSDKGALSLRQLMAHHAGLQAWIPFYQRTLENGLPDRHLYHSNADLDSEYPVARDMWLENRWVDTMWQTILRSELNPVKSYKYSDLGLIITGHAIGAISGKRLDQYAGEAFYKPLGLATTTFNPWKKGWTDRCAPTEEDRYFRQQRIQGYVHDMGAAMSGGVSGHAGLFSNANDLAKIFQMLLNGGTYAGRRYIQENTVKLFTTRYAGSTRRGIGFDMKELDPNATQNMSPLAGPNTFGHMGFTGNSVWADPEQQLIVVFLSNRTYPTMENNKLINQNFRPRVQSVVYQSLIK